MYSVHDFSAVLGSLSTAWSSRIANSPSTRSAQITLASHNHNGIYDSSATPSHLPWNTYNYCNAPHVNAPHYAAPDADPGATLAYVNAVIRHHKRTPDNRYPSENALNAAPWNCSGLQQYSYDGGTARVFHETASPAWHPFLSEIWNGTCDEGQLTLEGLADAVQHGRDFWSVYGDKLGFLSSVNEDDILFRTSTETRTFQVVGGLLSGMDPAMTNKPFPVLTQPAAIDSIPPRYSCPMANAIRNAYQSVPAWTNHLVENSELKGRLDKVLGTAGLESWASWYDHYFDTFTSRTCHGVPLPCSPQGECISPEDTMEVFRLGDYEYNYIWNAAENASTYSQLQFGVFMMELAQNLRAFRAESEGYKLKFYVGHDGTMIRLVSLLGLGRIAPLRWPALGSEVIIEVWRAGDGDHFVRVLHEGTPVASKDPELDLRWVPFDDFVTRVEAQVPDDLQLRCSNLRY